jgi:phosphoglucosamine mutase
VSRRWFGTDGIRGRAGEFPLVPEFLRRLGRALGEGVHGKLVLLARDTRASGSAIVDALAEGLLGEGADGLDLGVLPTAGLPVAMRARGAALGLVVSASHNPWADNGIKVFGAGGLKLADADEAALEARVAALEREEAPPSRTTHSGSSFAGAPRGGLRHADGASDYVAWLTARFAHLRLGGLRLLVDCANGSAHRTAPAVLAALGARVTPLFDQPDGRNINEGCGSTHLGALIARVRAAAGGCDAGLAFDGDADRVLFADPQGRTCDGDHVLGFLGPHLHARGELPGGALVATVMSNLGLQRALAARGVTLVRCPVGDRHVLAALQAGGYALGGEASGHVLFRDGGAYIGDGLYTTLRLLEALLAQRTTLAAVIDAVPRVPQVLLNVPVAAKPPVESLPRLQAAAAAAQARHGDDLRLVLRYSGTENLARVMVEGVDGGLVQRLAGELAEVWQAEIAARGAPS